MEWVEVEGKTVEVAVQAGLEELGISSVDEAEVEVIKEPERGFLGFGGSMALVRVKPKPKRKRRRRGGRRRGGRSGEQGGEASGDRPRQGGDKRGGGDRKKGGGGGGRPEKQSERRGDGGQGRRDGRKPRQQGEQRKSQQSKGREKAGGGDQNRGSQKKGEPAMQEEATPAVDIDGQADIVKEFLTGLLEAFGLDGDVAVRVDDGIVFADVTGEQTEALVGNRGAILQSILELCRTVVQRKSHASARIRLDIAGYTERRREALRIYATRLAEQVLDDGEEVMLEPMNPADRKVVHDAVAEIDDVRTYSEGEEPNRSVVIGLAPGAEPRKAAVEEATADEDSSADASEADAEDTSADEGGEVSGDATDEDGEAADDAEGDDEDGEESREG